VSKQKTSGVVLWQLLHDLPSAAATSLIPELPGCSDELRIQFLELLSAASVGVTEQLEGETNSCMCIDMPCTCQHYV
jgi:hypothetical protein